MDYTNTKAELLMKIGDLKRVNQDLRAEKQCITDALAIINNGPLDAHIQAKYRIYTLNQRVSELEAEIERLRALKE